MTTTLIYVLYCLQRVITQGAKTVVVPGIPPMGCSPLNLAMFPSADPAGYDPRTGCLKQLNDRPGHLPQNSLLQEAIIKDVQTKPSTEMPKSSTPISLLTPIIGIVVSPQKLG